VETSRTKFCWNPPSSFGDEACLSTKRHDPSTTCHVLQFVKITHTGLVSGTYNQQWRQCNQAVLQLDEGSTCWFPLKNPMSDPGVQTQRLKNRHALRCYVTIRSHHPLLFNAAALNEFTKFLMSTDYSCSEACEINQRYFSQYLRFLHNDYNRSRVKSENVRWVKDIRKMLQDTDHLTTGTAGPLICLWGKNYRKSSSR
jgi:hypothetical protein